MNKYCPNLLSPPRAGNKLCKNRKGFPKAVPNIVSGTLCDTPLAPPACAAPFSDKGYD